MKKLYVLVIGLSICLLSCNSDQNNTDPAASKQEAELNANPDYRAGLGLTVRSDCFGCHKIEGKLIGPSYVEVAQKYPSTPENISRLANTIIEGVVPGKGVWGTVAMTPHPQVTQEEAAQMVKYILLLKKGG